MFAYLDVASALLCWRLLPKASQMPRWEVIWQSKSEGSPYLHEAAPTDKGFSFPDRSSETHILNLRRFGRIKQSEASFAGWARLLSLLPVISLSLSPTPGASFPIQGLTHECLSWMRQQPTCSGHFANLNLCPSQSLEYFPWTLGALSRHPFLFLLNPPSSFRSQWPSLASPSHGAMSPPFAVLISTHSLT